MSRIPSRIVAIGASSVVGKVDPEKGGFIERLRAWHEQSDQHHYVFNLGISGDSTKGLQRRLVSESTIRKPDLIIIQFGLNDTIREGSVNAPLQTAPEQFEMKIKEILDDAKRLSDVIVVSVYPIDDTKTQPVSWRNIYYRLDDAEMFAEITKRVCAENGVPYLDVFSQWRKINYLPLLHSDGLHAGPDGHELIFQRVKSFLSALYQ